MKQGDIIRRLHGNVCEEAGRSPIQEVRIGIGYVGVRTGKDRLGLAALLLNDLPPGCSRMAGAGTFTNAPASRLTSYLVEGKNPLEKALGLAAANAVLHPGADEKEEEDSLALMMLTPGDRVAMVGFFPPLVPKIKATGAALAIIERNPSRTAVLGKKEQEDALKSCTVAVITATTLLNDTLEEVLGALDRPRHVALLGPSTPLSMDLFAGTPVTHLGGAVSLNTPRIMQIIGEGGGTPEMRPHLRFVNIIKGRDA